MVGKNCVMLQAHYLQIKKQCAVTGATHSLWFMSFITGREFFVGLSKRTNQRGAEILADTFKVGEGSFMPGTK